MRSITSRTLEGYQKLQGWVVFSADIAFLDRWSGGPLKGLVLLRKWSNVLIFCCLVFYCIILYCEFCFLVYTCFLSFFCKRSFRKTLLTRLSQAMSLHNALVLGIHCVCSALKRGEDYVKTSFPSYFGVEYIWSVCEETSRR